MARPTIDEKRLLKLRRQLFGKPNPVTPIQKLSKSKASLSYTPTASQSPTITTVDSIFLKKDLLKIIYLSAAAFSIQFLILFGLRNHILPSWI